MTLTVSAGVTSSGLAVSSGKSVVVLLDGELEFSNVLSGGSVSLTSGATGSFLTVSQGGVVSGEGDLTGVNFDAGEVSEANVDAYGLLEVLSGGVASFLDIQTSGTIMIESGAIATGTTVFSGALLDVQGSAAETYVDDGGQEVVFSKGVVSGDTIASGGLLVLAGGTAQDETVESGGSLDFGGSLKSSLTVAAVVGDEVTLSSVTLSSGATLNLVGAKVLSGVTLSLAAGAVAQSLVVSKGGVLLGPGDVGGASYAFGSVGGISVGGTAPNEAGELTLLSGGVASSLTVRDSGAVQAESGGRLSRTEVESGGVELLSSGGVGGGDVVRSGGALLLASGGSASDERVQSGGLLYFAGDLTSDFTLSANLVSANTQLSGVTVSSGGALAFDGATVVSGVTLSLGSGAGGFNLTVAKGATLDGPGYLVGSSDVYGSIDVTTMTVGSLELHAGAHASGVTISSDAVDLDSDEGIRVDSGARATATTAEQGGLLQVLGSATHTVVESGGAEIVSSGGVVADDTVQSGGTLYLLSGATASHETVLSRGGLVFAGDLTSNFTLPSVTGTTSRVELDGVTVSSGGLIELADATVLSGVTLSLASGALAFDLTVSKGAVLLGPGEVQADSEVAGSVSGVTLDGEMDLSSGASASGVAILEGGLRVESGATATGTLVSAYDLVFDSGSAAATVVSSGGEVEVYSGGVASGDIISSGGAEGVLAGGTASAEIVSSGGVAFVSSGGTVSGDEVLSGGLARVYAGGNAVGLTISGGGEATLSSGGTASGLVLDSGGHVIDNGKLRYAGSATLAGTLSGSGAIIEATSGVLLLSGKGAAFSGQVAIEGGTVELATSGAIGTGYVDFSEPATGSAVLQIDAADAPEAGGTFANAIHNFSGAHEAIDLRSIAFVAGASATIVGSTLVLSDGGKTYLFNIAGSTAGAYPVLSDGHGGTLIDPKAVAFAHTAAAFAPSDAAKTGLVSSASPTAVTPFAHAMASAGHG